MANEAGPFDHYAHALAYGLYQVPTGLELWLCSLVWRAAQDASMFSNRVMGLPRFNEDKNRLMGYIRWGSR